MFFFTFQNFVSFLFPPKFFALRAKKKTPKNFLALRARKQKRKCWASRRKTLATVVDVMELSLFWRLKSARSAIFSDIWGYISKKILFRASKQSTQFGEKFPPLLSIGTQQGGNFSLFEILDPKNRPLQIA